MPPTSSNQPEKSERAFLRVLQYSSSLSLGGMAALLYSIKEVNPRVRYQFGVGTVCAFILMAGATWMFWRILLQKHHLEGSSPSDRRIRALSLICLSVVLVGGMVAASLRALHNLPRARYVDVIEGTIMAFMVLGAIGVVFWRVVRFLEQDHERGIKAQEQQRREEEEEEE